MTGSLACSLAPQGGASWFLIWGDSRGVRKIWRRKCRSTPVSVAWETPWTEEPGGLGYYLMDRTESDRT